MIVLQESHITLNIELDGCYVTETYGDIVPSCLCERFDTYTDAYNRFIELRTNWLDFCEAAVNSSDDVGYFRY